MQKFKSKVKSIYQYVILACPESLTALRRHSGFGASVTVTFCLECERFWTAVRMTKRKTFNFLLAFLTFNFLLLTFPTLTSAHVLKTSGSIGAVMHVQPEDDPIVGEESSFYFEFKDKKGTFDPKNCACDFFIVQDGKEIYSQPLFQDNADPSLTNASVFYTFPSRGVYTIKVNGKPQSAGMFEPFALTYDMRVERTSAEPKTSENSNWFITHIPHLTGGVIGLSVLAFLALSEHRKRKKN